MPTSRYTNRTQVRNSSSSGSARSPSSVSTTPHRAPNRSRRRWPTGTSRAGRRSRRARGAAPSVRRGRVQPDVVADDVRPADVQVQELADVDTPRHRSPSSSPRRGVVLRQIRHLEAGALLRVAQIGGEDVLGQPSLGHQAGGESRPSPGTMSVSAWIRRRRTVRCRTRRRTRRGRRRQAQQVPERVRFGADHVVHPAPLSGLDDVGAAVESDRGIGAGERDGERQPARRRGLVEAGCATYSSGVRIPR